MSPKPMTTAHLRVAESKGHANHPMPASKPRAYTIAEMIGLVLLLSLIAGTYYVKTYGMPTFAMQAHAEVVTSEATAPSSTGIDWTAPSLFNKERRWQ